MNPDLLNNNYLIIRNFISDSEVKNLTLNFHKMNEEKPFPPCPQVSDSSGLIDSILGTEVLCLNCAKVSEIVKSTLLPTYSYIRIYKSGNELEKHTDRPACEISVTLHLDGDTSWPIWITTPYGEEVSVDLLPGDAMIYLGCIAPHWRTKYMGNNYTQLFFHYVRSKGIFKDAFFDKKDIDVAAMNIPQRDFDKRGHHVVYDKLLEEYNTL